jgi:phage N-6-adenine-methyltransferase
MSLVGFKARNHRQQVGKRGPNPKVDDRATAPEVFAPLHQRFGFTLDVAALPHNAKLERYFTPEQDGLMQSWRCERVWCNPPYSHIEPWVEKAWAEITSALSPAHLIVMLLPANRTEQGWWQRQIEPRRDQPYGVRVEFLPGRMRFIAHDADGIKPNERPPFGCCLAIWGGRR